jgi:hypothetical protein
MVRKQEKKRKRNLPTKASPIAEDKAIMNKEQGIASDRIFLGAFVNAYSRPVIEANISLTAIRIYLISRPPKNKKKRRSKLYTNNFVRSRLYPNI